MATAKKQDQSQTLEIVTLKTNEVRVCIKGTSPMIMNRLAEKARQQLLLPPAKKNAAEKAASLKHNPLEEFRASAHIIDDEGAPTLLGVPSVSVKGAMRSAALELPGATKAQIGRLTYVRGDLLSVYGVPQAFSTIVRMADVGRTPDVRTRLILPRWAMIVDVTFVTPQLTQQAVANLLATAGIVIGVGDWRPEKGSGSYGQFEICPSNDPEFLEIIERGGREAQAAAMQDPAFYNSESEELFMWFDSETRRRGMKVA